MIYSFDSWDNELYHHGIKGQKWGIRRYQNEDGTLTEAGKERYAKQIVKDLKTVNRANAHGNARFKKGRAYNATMHPVDDVVYAVQRKRAEKSRKRLEEVRNKHGVHQDLESFNKIENTRNAAYDLARNKLKDHKGSQAEYITQLSRLQHKYYKEALRKMGTSQNKLMKEAILADKRNNEATHAKAKEILGKYGNVPVGKAHADEALERYLWKFDD